MLESCTKQWSSCLEIMLSNNSPTPKTRERNVTNKIFFARLSFKIYGCNSRLDQIAFHHKWAQQMPNGNDFLTDKALLLWRILTFYVCPGPALFRERESSTQKWFSSIENIFAHDDYTQKLSASFLYENKNFMWCLQSAHTTHLNSLKLSIEPKNIFLCTIYTFSL